MNGKLKLERLASNVSGLYLPIMVTSLTRFQIVSAAAFMWAMLTMSLRLPSRRIIGSRARVIRIVPNVRT